MTELVHHLVGYDRSTEKAVYEHSIPSEEWKAIIDFLKADSDDPLMVDVYPLDGSAIRDVGGIIHSSLRPDLDYFIECSRGD